MLEKMGAKCLKIGTRESKIYMEKGIDGCNKQQRHINLIV
jgi:hypothetical protein